MARIYVTRTRSANFAKGLPLMAGIYFLWGMVPQHKRYRVAAREDRAELQTYATRDARSERCGSRDMERDSEADRGEGCSIHRRCDQETDERAVDEQRKARTVVMSVPCSQIYLYTPWIQARSGSSPKRNDGICQCSLRCPILISIQCAD